VDDTIDPRLLLLGLIESIPDETRAYGDNCSGSPPSTLFLSQALEETSGHGLTEQMSQLAAELRQFTVCKPHLHHILEIASLDEFLTSTNCLALIAAYSRRQYYHQWPIIHWPTFNPEQAALPLLLAIMLTGDTYSCRRNGTSGYVSPTSAMQKIADKYIFSHIKKCTSLGGPATNPHEVLELCQAAFLMNCLHINMNDMNLRQRVITNRHPLLINALRRRGLTGTIHELAGPGLEWHAFIYRETCIRLVTWTFLIDSLLTVYFNHPPLMSLAEMSNPLPCNDDIWDAGSMSSFKELMRYGHSSSRMLCLKVLVANLLSKDWTNALKEAYDELSTQHLYIILMALQPIVFNYHASLLCTVDISIVSAALDRWEPIWDRAIDRVPSNQQQWLGIVRYSREIAWLTRKIIEISITKESGHSDYLQQIAIYSPVSIHQFIQR
ncbi:hypothetical protein TRIATDRAFT_165879, partial [Trichoderma atroviride IMI 206040]